MIGSLTETTTCVTSVHNCYRNNNQQRGRVGVRQRKEEDIVDNTSHHQSVIQTATAVPTPLAQEILLR